jgi:hypothetical protein
MEEDKLLITRACRASCLPPDLLASERVLREALLKLGVKLTVGRKHRLIALLQQQAVAVPATPLRSVSVEGVIPRNLFTFWHDDPTAPQARARADAELVKCCLAVMRKRCKADGWQFRVLSPGADDLPPPPVEASTLTGAQLADWYRLAALASYGGVYVDATCITLQPLDHWVDRCSDAVQGFCFVPDGVTMESWAIAAPSGSAFVGAWRDEFGRALSRGVKAYCAELPTGLVSDGLRPSLEHGYLAIHASWCVVRARLRDATVRLQSPVEAGQPYRYLAEQQWDSPKAVEALFAKRAEDLSTTALIKLRGRERDSVAPLATYGRESWLARELLRATVPTTVTERMAFLRIGLDPDGS